MAKRRKGSDERRKPGTGYASQAKNGTWTGHYPKFGGGYHVKRGFSTRTTAEAWCDSLLVRQDDKENIDKGQQRTGAFIDVWINRSAKERDWKAKMLADVLFKLGYPKPFIGDIPLADVTPDHVDPIWDHMRLTIAESTVRQTRNYLYQVFEYARERRYITYNPVIKPGRRKRAKQKEPIRLTQAQSAKLLRTAERSFYALAWWLVLTLGLRAGEICGLRWGDIDLDLGIIHILQQNTDVRGVTTTDLPKNDKIRHVPLVRGLIPLFRLHYRACVLRATRGTRAGTWHEHGLVFPGRSGKPMNPVSLRHQLHDLTDACKLVPVTTHMLRHTAGKFYTDIQTPDNVTGAILGHTPNITGHYAPPDADAMRPWTEQVYRGLAGEIEKARKEKEA